MNYFAYSNQNSYDGTVPINVNKIYKKWRHLFHGFWLVFDLRQFFRKIKNRDFLWKFNSLTFHFFYSLGFLNGECYGSHSNCLWLYSLSAFRIKVRKLYFISERLTITSQRGCKIIKNHVFFNFLIKKNTNTWFRTFQTKM